MTKRFKIGLDLITIEDTSKEYGALNQDEVVELLNELHEENQALITHSQQQYELMMTAKKENEQLKFERDRYKRLSEIRHEIINNRILTIKEFIDNCSDKKVKKTLEQLFHSEVNEYDLSKKIRKLEKENEQLKEALFFYISVAITETSSHINEDLEKECNQLLKCSYKEALKKYDTSKYE